MLRQNLLKKIISCPAGAAGLAGVLLLLLPAVYTPLIANGRPFVLIAEGRVSFPFLEFIFAPDSSEFFIYQFCNYTMYA